MNVEASRPIYSTYVLTVKPQFLSPTLSSSALNSSINTLSQMAPTYYAQFLELLYPLTPALKGFAICSMVVGGAIPFVPQYLLIRRTSSAEGFSLYVCLTLLAANILRIFFWYES